MILVLSTGRKENFCSVLQEGHNEETANTRRTNKQKLINIGLKHK